MTAHDITFHGLEGGESRLGDDRNKAVLVANAASECGLTPQYARLQQLWQCYRPRGVVVLGVPSNDLGEQEPGDAARIRAPCADTYGADFPLAARRTVIGEAGAPVFHWLRAQAGEAALTAWNFHKYLIDPRRELAGAWPSNVEPLSAEITEAIQAVLPEE